MKKMNEKTLFGLAIALVLVGIVLCRVASSMEISLKTEAEYETNSYTITDEFEDITINVSTASVIFEESANDTIQVICYEATDDKHQVGISNKTLTITGTLKNVSSFLNWHTLTDNPVITIILPKGSYGRLTIESNTGSITIPSGYLFDSMNLQNDTGSLTCSADVKNQLKAEFNTGKIVLSELQAGMIVLENDTGAIELNNITCNGDMQIENNVGSITLKDVDCGSASIDSDTGSINLDSLICNDRLEIESDTGSITFNDCDGKTIEIESDTGSVSGNFLTGKTYITKTDTGSVSVPANSGTGTCTIETDTGSICIN